MRPPIHGPYYPLTPTPERLLQLQQQAVPTWLDEWNLVPGQPWVDALGQALQECSGCVVFLGPGGTGPWHHEEVRSALNRAARDTSYRLVPVLLPGAKPERLSQLPGFLANRTWVDFARGLNDSEALHRLVCGIQGREPGPPSGVSYVPGRNPYRGLQVFDVDDAPLFFGRQTLTRELLARLGREPRFLSVLGPSGSGKSSLARAGLLASLRAGGHPGSAAWPQLVIRPGAFPLEALAVGVATKLRPGTDPSVLIRRLETREEALHREVRMALEGHPERRAVVLVDQAEEAFTLCAREADRAAFFANLLYAATVQTGQTLVVLALRSDFYSRFAEHQQLAALVSENQLLVSPMSKGQLREAIALPAERSGRPLQRALVDQLLRDAEGRPGSLPLLEHALAQLWERPEPALGIGEYLSMGGLAGALDSRAEQVFGKLTPSQQKTCRRLFLRLAQPGEHVLDTKRRVRVDELPADQHEVSRAFSGERVHLLVASREGNHDVVELAHEELMRRWERLHRWIREDSSGQQLHRRLMTDAAEWSAPSPDKRDESLLYRGTKLKEVQRWLTTLPDEERMSLLNASEAVFLEHSREAENRAQLEQERATLAEDRLRFLGDVGGLMHSRLDEGAESGAPLKTIAALSVLKLAEWCVVVLRGADGKLEQLAAAHVDLEKTALLRGLHDWLGKEEALLHIPDVLAGERARLYGEITDEEINAEVSDPELLMCIHEVGLRSAIVVPVTTRAGTIGAIVLAAGPSRRRYDESDLTQAVELARRAALATDNTELFIQKTREAELRDNFLAGASHELGTLGLHLDALMMEAKVLSKREPGLSRFQESLNRAMFHSERLGGLLRSFWTSPGGGKATR